MVTRNNNTNSRRNSRANNKRDPEQIRLERRSGDEHFERFPDNKHFRVNHDVRSLEELCRIKIHDCVPKGSMPRFVHGLDIGEGMKNYLTFGVHPL